MASSQRPRPRLENPLIVTRERWVAALLKEYFHRHDIASEYFDRGAVESRVPYNPVEPTPDDLRGRLVATDRPELAPYASVVIEPGFATLDEDLSPGIGLYAWVPARGNVGRIGLLVAERGATDRALRKKLGLPHVPAGHARHVPCLEDAQPEDVRGLHIAGWLPLLPLWLACHAHAVTAVALPCSGPEPAPKETLTYHVVPHWFSCDL